MGIISVRDYRQPIQQEVSPTEYVYTRTLMVIVDSPATNCKAVLDACPPVGVTLQTPWGNDAEARCIKRTPRQDVGNLLMWWVTCEYRSTIPPKLGLKLGGEGNPRQENKNPTLRPPTLSGNFNLIRTPAVQDLDGQWVLNSAGDPFDKPKYIESGAPTITFVQNMPTMPGRDLNRFYRAVNSTEFLGWPKDEARLNNFSFSGAVWENTFVYWQYHYTFEFGAHVTQDELIVDYGYQELKPGSDSEKVRMKDAFGNFAPDKLDGQGRRYSGPKGEAVYREFRFFKRMDFNELFPNGMPWD